MNRVHLAVVLLAFSICGVAHAQARGPAAEEVQEHGQEIEKRRRTFESPWKYHDRDEYEAQQAWQWVRERAMKEREELLHPAVRARKLAELDTWLRRIPGRFRIEGLIKKLENGAVVRGKVTGVADCTSIGESVGVQCILSATWPILETQLPDFMRAPPPRPGPSEMLRTINPAALVIGLNPDPPGIRAQMVDAESLTHTWVGQLWENTVWASRANRALSGRTLQPLQIIAEPDSEVVTIVLRSGVVVALTLTMYRDRQAQAEKPIKTLRSR